MSVFWCNNASHQLRPRGFLHSSTLGELPRPQGFLHSVLPRRGHPYRILGHFLHLSQGLPRALLLHDEQRKPASKAKTRVRRISAVPARGAVCSVSEKKTDTMGLKSEERRRQSKPRQGKAIQRKAKYNVRQGMARQGKKQGKVRQSKKTQGKAMHGKAMKCKTI